MGDDLPPHPSCLWILLCSDSFVTIGHGIEFGPNTTALDSTWDVDPTHYCGDGFCDAIEATGLPNENLDVLIAQLTVRQGFGVFGTVTSIPGA
jgi:hypothetical protein